VNKWLLEIYYTVKINEFYKALWPYGRLTHIK